MEPDLNYVGLGFVAAFVLSVAFLLGFCRDGLMREDDHEDKR